MKLKNVKELLSTDLGIEGQLLIPRKIMDTLVEEVDKALIPRSEAAMFFGPGEIPGSSVDVDLETPNSMDIRLVAEGAEVPMDQSAYTTFNVKPDKYGVAIRITTEMLEDSKWNLLQRNIKTAGKRFAENENFLTITQALDNASNTVVGGSAFTITNLTAGLQFLDDLDYEGTSLFIGMEVLNDLRNIDTFVEADKVGNTDMIQKGFQGVLYGLNVMKVSTNAGMTTTTAYITDKNEAYVGAEKRGLTLAQFDLETFDMTGAVLTQRIRFRELRADAIVKITTT